MSEAQKTINVRVPLSDYLVLRGASGREGLSLRAWLRDQLHRIAQIVEREGAPARRGQVRQLAKP